MTAAATQADQIARALTSICNAGTARIAKAAAMVNSGKTHRTDLPGTWLVTASNGTSHYVTTATTCTCPDRAPLCKHSLAIIIATLAQPAS